MVVREGDEKIKQTVGRKMKVELSREVGAREISMEDGTKRAGVLVEAVQ